RGGVALLVGGTGLYIRAVARDLPLEEQGSDPTARARYEHRLAGEGLHTLVAELRSRAPTVAGRTDLANPRRVVRALERVELVGDRPPSPPRGYPVKSTWIGLDTDIATNDRWIAARAEQQLADGLIEETAALRQRYDTGAPAFSAIGYAEALAVLDGRLTRDEALAAMIRRTRQLARRQRTWFRAEPGVEWLDATTDPLHVALELVARAGLA
ncbi:MAG TPA: tRNA dimethylallyltransferase, partial [Candidatus Limnocylindrales bacterium]